MIRYSFNDIFTEDTPIEKYEIDGKEIFVKREDMFSHYPAPHLAKLRGVKDLIIRLNEERGLTTFGAFDTRVSKSGWGLAAVCNVLGLNAIAGYPKLKAETELPKNQQESQSLGAEVIGLPAGRTAISYFKFKRIVLERKGFLLPMGLTCVETTINTAKVSAKLPEEFNSGSIVVSTGTGTILSGVLLGLKKLPNVYGISCGMSIDRQYSRINDLLTESKMLKFGQLNKIFYRLKLINPKRYGYYDKEEIETPFPSSPYYDKKAWVWLLENYNILEKPVLFWNIGV